MNESRKIEHVTQENRNEIQQNQEQQGKGEKSNQGRMENSQRFGNPELQPTNTKKGHSNNRNRGEGKSSNIECNKPRILQNQNRKLNYNQGISKLQ